MNYAYIVVNTDESGKMEDLEYSIEVFSSKEKAIAFLKKSAEKIKNMRGDNITIIQDDEDTFYAKEKKFYCCYSIYIIQKILN